MDKHLRVAGEVLRYRDEGRGPAAVFVHGWTLDLEMWEPQAAVLSSSRRIIRMDRRGFGRSTGRPSLADDVSDLGRLIEELQLNRFALIGMSQGTRVALQFAAISPQLIACLILDGPPEFGPSRATEEIPYAHYRTLAQTQGMAAFRTEWARHPLVGLRTSDPEARASCDRMIARYPGHDLTDPVPPATCAVDLAAVAAHRLPTLVISGEHDLSSRQQSAANLARQLGAAQRAQIPNAAHLCNIDNPVAYNRVLKGFLDCHPN